MKTLQHQELNSSDISVRHLKYPKLLGAVLLVLGVFGFLIFIHRLSYYVFEYDAQYSPVDYGKYNILSYFTVQSNFFVYVYLTLFAFSLFGNKHAQKIAYNPTAGALVTTYILLTGIVYCCGIPLGFTPPFKWDSAVHSMSSFIQVYYHMIIPTIMLILWFFPMTNKKTPHRNVWAVGIYPLVYSLFSIIRGAFSHPTFYPYPFYKPDFIFNLFCKGQPYSPFKGYLLMLPVLIVGIGLFILVGRLIILINEKMSNKLKSN